MDTANAGGIGYALMIATMYLTETITTCVDTHHRRYFIINRLKAEKKIRKKSTKLKPCPFCGRIPNVTAMCDIQYTSHGSWGHYAKRESCCKATKMGQTESFFCNDFEKPDYRLWWDMFSRIIDCWNKRHSD